MTPLRSLGLAAIVLLVACSSSTQERPGSSPGRCVDPPATEADQSSPTDLSVEPNPAAAGSSAMLTIGADGLGADASIGAGAEWQCWDGSGWIPTHQIVRGFDDDAGQAIEVAPGATTTIPAIGLPVPSSFPIVIPNVSPGVYRIIDDVSDGGAIITGVVLVEVLEAG